MGCCGLLRIGFSGRSIWILAMSEWDKKERRNGGQPGGNKDHDLLTRIDVNLSNFMSRFDVHTKDDDKKFDALFKRTSTLQKFMWLITGAVVIAEFMIKVFK